MSDKKYIAPPGRSAGFKHYLVGLWKYTGSLRKRAYFDIILTPAQVFMVIQILNDSPGVRHDSMVVSNLVHIIGSSVVIYFTYITIRLTPFIKAVGTEFFKIDGLMGGGDEERRAYNAAAAGGDIVTGYSGRVGYNGDVNINPVYSYARSRGENAKEWARIKYGIKYLVMISLILPMGWLIGWPCAMWCYHKQTQSSQQ